MTGPGGEPGLRLEHVLCFSAAADIDDHAADYAAAGFVPMTLAARWPPGLRNRFVGLWPEYLELVGVEDEAVFAASDDPVRRFRPGARPFSIGLLCADVHALHAAWTARGVPLPPVRTDSPEGMPVGSDPVFAFLELPDHTLPGVDAFALTSFFRPVPPTRRQVWVAPNTTFGLAGLTLVADDPPAVARRWAKVLGPAARLDASGRSLTLGPHRIGWRTAAELAAAFDVRLPPAAHHAGGIALVHVLAIDPAEVARRVAANGRPVVRRPDGTVLVRPSAADGFRLLIEPGDPDAWRAHRDRTLGVAHELVRMDTFLGGAGRPYGELRLRPAGPADAAGIAALAEAVLPATYDPITPAGYTRHLIDSFWSPAATEGTLVAAGEQLWVADNVAGEVVAVAHCARRGTAEVILWRLYVRPAVRGRGLGRALLAACLGTYPAEVTTVTTEYVATNQPAAAFYRRLGFTSPTPTRVRWSGHDIEIVYVSRPR